tara:strand:- start:539 stop:1096 length:558 start_codon:yes stop_codon:yes gene_type:complete
MLIYKTIKSILVIFCATLILSGCGNLPKPDWSKKTPIEPNAKKRAQQNVRDGKGLLFKSGKSGSGNFLFASSNPMWKSTLDTLSFISLANVDYSGGVIITDWYSEENTNEAIKITVRFLSNEIRADGFIVDLYKRNCVNNKCSTQKIDDDLISEIKDNILKKAAVYKIQDGKRKKKNTQQKVYKD